MSSYNGSNNKTVEITSKDVTRFPELFKTNKHKNNEYKSACAKYVRENIKKLKRDRESRAEEVYKQKLREQQQFNELLEKYQNFKSRRNDKTLLSNKRGRHSVLCSSQPILEPLRLAKMQHEPKSALEKEIRLDVTSKAKVSDLMSQNDFKSPKPVSLKKGNNSRSMMNLLPNIRESLIDVMSSRRPSEIHTVDEMEELPIEERMAKLPHWKYKASFESYISGITTITPDVKEDFMELYKKKDFKGIYSMLGKSKPLKKYFDSFVAEAGEEDMSPEIKQKKRSEEAKVSKNENLELKPAYLDKAKVQSRLFGEIQSTDTSIDWKNLEKMSKEAIGKADLPKPRLLSLQNVLTNEIVRLKKQDEKYAKELFKNIGKDKKEESERKKTMMRKEIALSRSKKLSIVLAEVERIMAVKEAEKKAPNGVTVDPKKQIFLSKFDINSTPRVVGPDGVEEPMPTEAQVKNLRKKDYYENRVKKAFQDGKKKTKA